MVWPEECDGRADSWGCRLMNGTANIFSLRKDLWKQKPVAGLKITPGVIGSLENSIYVLTPRLTNEQKGVMHMRSHACLLRQYTWTLENCTGTNTLPFPAPTLFTYWFPKCACSGSWRRRRTGLPPGVDGQLSLSSLLSLSLTLMEPTLSPVCTSYEASQILTKVLANIKENHSIKRCALMSVSHPTLFISSAWL